MSEQNWQDNQEEIFDYLLALRDSGVTNMFGASAYLQDEFGLTNRESRDALITWMKNF